MKSKVVRFRVNTEQFEMLDKNASLKGYINLTPYLRDLIFKKSFTFEKMISEIHQEVVNGRRNKVTGLDQKILFWNLVHFIHKES